MFVLALTILVVVGFGALIRNFLLAVLMAVIFSGVLHPFYRRVRVGLRLRPALASGVTIVIVVIAVGIPLVAVAGLVGTEALAISKAVSPWLREHLGGESAQMLNLPDWLPFHDELEAHKSQVLARAGELASGFGQFLFESIRDATRGTVGVILNLFVFLYAMFFFLMRGPALVDSALRYLPLDEDDRTELAERGLTVTKATLKSILVIGILQGLLVTLAFWVLGLAGAAFWGTVVLILSAIPGLGSAIVWLPTSIYLLAIGQTVDAIALLVWGALVVGLIDNILRPRMVGEETRIPDLLILLSILGGIAAFGVVGIVIGPILAAVFLTALDIYRTAFADILPPPHPSDRRDEEDSKGQE